MDAIDYLLILAAGHDAAWLVIALRLNSERREPDPWQMWLDEGGSE